jgi:peptidoglycan/LPS O-acetylase OafA/YrhL
MTAPETLRTTALFVVFFHMSWTSVLAQQSFARNSYLMVDFFFVLSGFVVTYAYGKKLASITNVWKFVWLRFWRLYPMHFTMLIVFLLFETLTWAAYHYFGVGHGHAFQTNNAYSFAGNLFLVQSLGLFSLGTFNIPSWSISVEFYTYLVFALVTVLLGRRRLVISMIIVLCSGTVLVALGPAAISMTVDFGFFRGLTGFFAGALVFMAYENVCSKVAPSYARPLEYLAFGTIACFIAFIQLKGKGYSDLAIYPLSAILIFSVALAPQSGPVRVLNLAPLRWLGDISYSVYMVHASVLWVAKQVLVHVFHAKEIIPAGTSSRFLICGEAVGLAVAIAATLAVLALSHVTYRTIERPLRDWSKTAWPPGKLQAAALRRPA